MDVSVKANEGDYGRNFHCKSSTTQELMTALQTDKCYHSIDIQLYDRDLDGDGRLLAERVAKLGVKTVSIFGPVCAELLAFIQTLCEESIQVNWQRFEYGLAEVSYDPKFLWVRQVTDHDATSFGDTARVVEVCAAKLLARHGAKVEIYSVPTFNLHFGRALGLMLKRCADITLSFDRSSEATLALLKEVTCEAQKEITVSFDDPMDQAHVETILSSKAKCLKFRKKSLPAALHQQLDLASTTLSSNLEELVFEGDMNVEPWISMIKEQKHKQDFALGLDVPESCDHRWVIKLLSSLQEVNLKLSLPRFQPHFLSSSDEGAIINKMKDYRHLMALKHGGHRSTYFDDCVDFFCQRNTLDKKNPGVFEKGTTSLKIQVIMALLEKSGNELCKLSLIFQILVDSPCLFHH